MITLRNVLKNYSSEVAIGPVDLNIIEGGITALVGPNGAGKSTLLTMIGRLLGMDDGVIEIAGYDIAKTKSKDLAKIVSILRQENHFITRLTVRQLVGFGRFPHSNGRLTVVDEEAISQAVDFMHLGDLEGRYLDELSGGQRQRAYVAMVLAQDTEYVLLDEPLNNLDVAHSHAMLQTLRRAADELGKTVVIVVHDINYASCWADQIVAMKDGGVRAIGTPSEIVQRDLLREIFELDIEVAEFRGHRIAHFYLPVPMCGNCHRSKVDGCCLDGSPHVAAPLPLGMPA
ncbi:iron complex transport system ATP-binding protein [Tessaracoccus bendigoensis DSM 12906]|uniref:Iron complex transport system ATP-binding protein n=1 Tax=Tessaracoccus bendigoensis DSM 12906 TaxID=1123357 RepID=A0A1M6MI22_9ACTN|nr:ATP-binding cassette domain-containing protein [Tessaracoccus bendigoensis]SHJ83161.1 iron complex transport system ATP-binding protein [Tessaracoccus bendigoensis DSM 12906]